MNFLNTLCIIFIVLKLCKVIAWSWWWVLSPLWLPLVALIVFAFVGILIS